MIIRKTKSFTLIEFIIVFTLLSVAAVGIISVFSVGIKVWRKAEEQSTPQSAIMLTAFEIENSIKHIQIFDGAVLKGDKQTFSFPAFIYGEYLYFRYSYDKQKNSLYKKVLTFDEYKEESLKGQSKQFVETFDEFTLNYLVNSNDIGMDYQWSEEYEKELGNLYAIRLCMKRSNLDSCRVFNLVKDVFK